MDSRKFKVVKEFSLLENSIYRFHQEREMKSEWERLCWKGGVRHVISKRLLFGMYTVSGASGVRKSSHYMSVDVCLIKRT